MKPGEFLNHQHQKEVDSGRNKIPKSLSEAVEKAEANSYLSNVRSDLRINRIYYPGCGSDATLEPVFTGKIAYLDHAIKRVDAGKMGFVGDFITPPAEITDLSFDAAFIKDLHLHLLENPNDAPSQQRLQAILSKVKNNGFVLYGVRKACDKWEGEVGFLESSGTVSPVTLGYSNPNFRIYRKNG